MGKMELIDSLISQIANLNTRRMGDIENQFWDNTCELRFNDETSRLKKELIEACQDYKKGE
jgi:hypothetical protein